MKEQSRASKRSDWNAADEDALRQAALALQSGRARAAEQIVQGLLTRHAGHPGALQLLGMTLLAQDRPREAFAPLQEAARSRPGPAVETYLGVALRRTSRPDEAVTVLRRASERQPTIPQAWYELGLLLYEQRQFAQAQAALERGRQIASGTIEFSLALGSMFLERGEASKAESAFASVVAGAPDHSGALLGLGSALMARGEFDRAAERFRRAIARDPTLARAQLLLASCLFELGKPEQAVTALRTLVRISPQAFGDTLTVCAGSGRGRLWLRPSRAAEFFELKKGG